MRKLLAVLAVVSLGVGAWAEDDYVAYAETNKGEELPFPENAREIVEKNAKKLVGVRWGDYSGKKIRIGVIPADNQSNVRSYAWHGGVYSAEADTVPINGIEALLTDALTKTGRFRILTRTDDLNDVLGEQDLGDSGRVAKPSAAKIGQVLGAQYLIQLVVNDYSPDAGGGKVGLGGFSRRLRGIGGAAVGKKKSSVQMTFKLIDAETSEIIASEVVRSQIKDLAVGFGGGGWGGSGALGGFVSSYSKTPVGQAVMAGVNIGVVELVKQIGNFPTQGSVVKVDGDRVILNLGDGAVEVGDTLTARSQGEALIDPETGLDLGSEEEDIGQVKVTDVKEKFSYAVAVGFDAAKLSAGDKVVGNDEPSPLKFGPAWKD